MRPSGRPRQYNDLTIESPALRPTPEMIADAIRRNGAPRSVTAAICGDPPFEQSALGKKLAEASV